MGILIWLVVGGLVGWVASLIMKTDGSQGIVLNVVVGIVGALIAGYFISPLVGVASINQNALNIGSILVSLVGAIILIGIVKLVRGGVRSTEALPAPVGGEAKAARMRARLMRCCWPHFQRTWRSPQVRHGALQRALDTL